MKVIFPDLPITRMNPEKGDRCFEVMSPFRFVINRDLLEIPVGFYTDWATTGPAASIISPIDPQICRPALAHDFLYFTGYGGSQAVCDEFLEAAMDAEGAGWLKRRIVFMGVSIAGTVVWKMYRQSVKYTLHKSIYSTAAGQPLLLMQVAGWNREVKQ